LDSGFLTHGCLKVGTYRPLYEVCGLEKWLIAGILISNNYGYIGLGSR